MIGTFALQSIAEALAVRIVDCVLGGTLIGLAATAMLQLSPRRDSSLRFAGWFSALLAIAAMPLVSAAMHSQGQVSGATISHPALMLPAGWAMYVFVAWAAMAALGLLRLAVSLWQMRAVRKSCVVIDTLELEPRLRQALDGSRWTRAVSLCTSDRVQVPTALGLIAPAVVIPRWLLAELSPEDLSQIVLHEVAHLRRWDDWTNVVQKLIRAVLFFHPAVWWIERKLSLEREMACDDAVLAATGAPRSYAECLTRLAEKSLVRRTLALAQASLGPERQTVLRVTQILDAKHPRGTRNGWKWTMPLVAGLAIASAFVASKEPQLVAFEKTPAVVRDAGTLGVESSPVTGVPKAFVTNVAQRSRNPLPHHPPQFLQAKAVQARNIERAASTANQSGITLPQLEAQRAFILESVIEEPAIVHTTAAGTIPLPSTGTILFIVQRQAGTSDQPVYEIQWWRLTVLHPAPRPSGPEIPKKT